jgi:hypothetical protein
MEVATMNYTAPTTRLQEQNNALALNILSLAAVMPLTQAVFELSDNPSNTLSRLHEILNSLYERKRVNDGIDILCLIYGVLGIEYADMLTLLRGDTESASCFLYEYITDVDELLQELAEKK